MAGAIRFAQGIDLSEASTGADSNVTTGSASLVDLLNVLQQKQVYFLPVAPQSGLGIAGRGQSGEVNQSTADVATTLTFKNGIPSKRISDNDRCQDWYCLLTEISILQHEPIRSNPHIIDLVGVSWKAEAGTYGENMRVWPYTVTTKVNKGTLGDFLLQDEIEAPVRLQICAELVEAFELMHVCGVGHGDIKPDNILVDEDEEGTICCKVVDFGSSAICGQLRTPEWSPPWNAPELPASQQRYVSAESIIAADLYSFGLLAAHILIPQENLVSADVFLLGKSSTNVESLTSFQETESLRQKLLLITDTSNLPLQHQKLLKTILSGTLCWDPSLRDLKWKSLVPLLGEYAYRAVSGFSHQLLHAPQIGFLPSDQCEHKTFDIISALGELDDVDYILRNNIAEDMEAKVKSITCSECSHRYAFQLSLCYLIGFGVTKNHEKCQSWLANANIAEGVMKKTIERLSAQYQLTGRLPDQVRDAISIGVLVTLDRTEQYRLQGRLVDAEKSLTAEILARESEIGTIHICLTKLKSDLAQIYKVQGRFLEAENLQKEVTSVRSAKFGDRHPSVLSSIASFAAILAERGSLLEAEAAQRRIQILFNEVLGEEHPETVIALQNLGVTLHSQSRHREAAEVFRQVSKIRGKTLTVNHPLTIRADLCLASALHGQGLLNEAKDQMSQITKRSSEAGDAVIEAHVLMNQASMYIEQGMLQEAEKAALRSIRLLKSKRRLDKDDPLRHNAQEILAMVYGEKRDFEAQEKLLRTILQAKSSLDKHNPSVSNTKVFLAANLFRQSRIQESALQAREVLDVLKDSLVLDPENFLESTGLIASGMSSVGRNEEAEALRVELLLSYEKTLGDSRPFTIRARSGLADFYADRGLFDKAQKYHLRNLEMLLENGNLSGLSVKTARELSMIYREQSRFEEAMKMCEDAISWSEILVGETHTETLAARSALAKVYFQMGRLDEAEELYNSILLCDLTGTDLEIYVLENSAEVFKAKGLYEKADEQVRKAHLCCVTRLGDKHVTTIKLVGNILGNQLRDQLTTELEAKVLSNMRSKIEILGPQHFSTIKTMSDLAYAYGENGRLEDAERLYDEIEANGCKANLQNESRYATYCAKRADFYFQAGQYDRAEKLELEGLEIRQRLLPEGHNAILVSMSNLASVCNAQRKFSEAEKYLKIVVSTRESNLPPDAPLTLNAKNYLASVLCHKGQLDDSEAMFESVLKALERTGGGTIAIQNQKDTLRQVQETRRRLQDQPRATG